MDINLIKLLERYVDMNAKETTDMVPICSFAAQGEAVYMIERKFDVDSGKEVSPLYTQVDLKALADLQTTLGNIIPVLDSVKTQVATIDATIIKKPFEPFPGTETP